MKPIWKGHLKLGFVNVPVKVYSATSSKTITFNSLHSECMSRIQYEKKCPIHGVVPNEEVVKAYAYEDEKYVIISPEDLSKIQLESFESISITQFIDQDAIDPIFVQNSYYLVPDGPVAQEGYAVLRESIKKKGKMGLGKVTMRGKEYLAALWVKNSAIAMSTLYYPNEIKSTSSIEELKISSKPRKSRVQLAEQLIDSYTTKFKPQQFRDEYSRQLLNIIKAKVEGREIETPPQVKVEKDVSLTEALKQSVAMAQAGAKHKIPKKKEMAKTKPVPTKKERVKAI